MGRTFAGFLGAAEQERRDDYQAAVRRSTEKMARAVNRARAAGFPESQVPFAAMAFETLKMQRTEEPTVAEVRERVKAQYPWLFEATP